MYRTNREIVAIVELDWVQGAIMLCARLCLAAVFLVSAVSRIMDWQGSVLFLVSHGLGGFAQPLCALSLLLELAGGLSLVFGLKTRIGAGVLALFVIGVAITQNMLFVYSGDQAALQVSMILKDVAIIGGLLLVACFGAGPYSVDNADERIETIESLKASAEHELLSSR